MKFPELKRCGEKKGAAPVAGTAQRVLRTTGPDPFFSPQRCRTARRKAFTVFHVVFVVALLALLAGLLLPALQWTRAMSSRNRCQDNLRHILTGIQAYSVANEKRLPPYSHAESNSPGSVLYWLLPAIGQERVLEQSYGKGGWYGCKSVPIPAYQCPADFTMLNGLTQNSPMSQVGGSSYAANFRVFVGDSDNGTFELSSPCSLSEIPDGASNTILLAERAASNNLGETVGVNAWGWPGGDNNSGYYFGPLFAHPKQGVNLPQFAPGPIGGPGAPLWQTVQGFHFGTTLVGMGDGAVRVVGYSVGISTWMGMVLPDDGGGDSW